MATEIQSIKADFQLVKADLITALYRFYAAKAPRDVVAPKHLDKVLECARRAVLRAMHTETMKPVWNNDGLTDPDESHYDTILAEIIKAIDAHA